MFNRWHAIILTVVFFLFVIALVISIEHYADRKRQQMISAGYELVTIPVTSKEVWRKKGSLLNK